MILEDLSTLHVSLGGGGACGPIAGRKEPGKHYSMGGVLPTVVRLQPLKNRSRILAHGQIGYRDH